jgi:glycosyltransferase involved in cell wall biosynthesis
MGNKSAIYHLLDHSWAHLLRYVPKESIKISTVHDLIPFRYPDSLSDRQMARWKQSIEWLKRCDFLMADSDFTKSEIIHWLGVPERKISVVPLGVQPCGDNPVVETTLTSRTREVRLRGADLIIGALGPAGGRKNLRVLIPALENLRLEGLHIVVARGGPAMGPEENAWSAELRGTGQWLELGMLTDSQVAEFYQQIDVLVMPSLHEGFGLPVLEAMAASVPVLCSNATSLPEVGGDAVLYFHPESHAEVAEGMRRMMDPEIRQKYRELGGLRAADFTWDHTLALCRGIYRQFS